MGLKNYSQKRNFKATPEPAGKKKKSSKSLVFVVQRHNASHLHYDFRLEMEGVLKSWAVPKGPSMNPKDKRLAMMVEDHPFDYRTFEGIIPEGNYGAGTVEIWDNGNYTAANPSENGTEKELLKELKAGNLKFVMNGKKLKGEFALVKLKNDEKQKNAWLLIKHSDDYSVDKNYTSEDYPSLTVLKGKSFIKKFKEEKKKKREERNRNASGNPVTKKPVSKKKLTDFIKPMLAKETDEPFDDDQWLFEIKWDGYRAIAETGKQLKLYSRNGLSFLEKYPEVNDALSEIKERLVLDGEIVALDENGNPNFQLLQSYDPSEAHLVYYVFDILKKDGKDLTSLPLEERKSILQKTLATNDVVRYSDHIAGEGKSFFNAIRERNMEGIMAKRADSGYITGERTGNWLKIKNHHGQEAVIAGFTEPRKSRKFFGSLVLGIYEGKELKYTGHTGTGFNDETLKLLHEKLTPLIQKESPFKEIPKTNMPATWVKPKLVCNVKFSEITKDGIMRHPVFMGLREDKAPKEVINEKKRKVKEPSHQVSKRNVTAMKKTAKDSSTSKKEKTKGNNPGKTSSTENEKEVKLNSQTVKLTNLKKVYFPKEKITKGDIIEYYQSVSSYLLPYLKDRPQSLLRNPNGILDSGFFQKDAGEVAPEWVKSKKIFSESANKEVDYLICNDRATLAYMNNLGCIELNPWHSRIGSLDNPDYMAMDIDPSPKNTFEQVIETALAVKEVFDKAGATCYCKTSGATGLHIYAPLGAKYDYDQVKEFAHIIAIMTSDLVPDFTSLIRPLKKRGDKIYIDFLQNRRGQTLASVYSARPKPGASVSTPLEWKEVKKGLHPSQFTIKSVLARMKKTGDLFKGVLGKGIDMQKCLKRLDA